MLTLAFLLRKAFIGGRADTQVYLYHALVIVLPTIEYYHKRWTGVFHTYKALGPPSYWIIWGDMLVTNSRAPSDILF